MTGYRIEELTYSYPSGRMFSRGKEAEKGPRVLNRVSFEVAAGEVFGIVGGSGSGKTTLVSLMCGLITPPPGMVFFGERDISAFTSGERKDYFRRVQLVFQDPRSSFNPSKTVEQSLHAALRAAGIRDKGERTDKIARSLEDVRLSANLLPRLPRELSGGQRQRAAIARALSLEPDVLVLDEPVSALDVSVQAGVMNTLKEILRQRNLTVLLVAHDLAVVGYMTDRTAVLREGELAEIAPSHELFTKASHPYTKELIRAIPVLSALKKGST